MNIEKLRNIIEGILFAAEQPVTLDTLAAILEPANREEIVAIVESLVEEWQSMNRAFHIVAVAGGWQFRTKPDTGAWLQRLRQEKPSKLSRAALETLAIIAYKQPITRPEIEDLRGVDSGAVIKNLLDRNLVKIVGKKDAPGKPVVYGTTARFLEVFSLRDLGSLPSLRDLKELDDGGEQQLVLPAFPPAETPLGKPAEEEQISAEDPEAERRRKIRESVRSMFADLPVRPDQPLTLAAIDGLPAEGDDANVLAEVQRAIQRQKELAARAEALLDDAEKDYLEKVTTPLGESEPGSKEDKEQPRESTPVPDGSDKEA